MSSDNAWDCPVLADILARNPLNVIDVGAAGGIDPVWRPILAAGFATAAGFEALPDNFKKLKPNERIKFFQLAVSDTVGTATFFGRSTIGSLVRRERREQRFGEQYQEFDVKTETLAHLRAEGTIAPIDALKIDVEGAEVAVLRGAADSLNEALYLKAEFAFDRSSGSAFDVIDRIAFDHGLKLFDFAANYTGYEALSGGDVLYLRNIKNLLAEPRDRDGLRVRAAKLIVVSLINNYRQYAYVCARHASEVGLFSPEEAKTLADFITAPVYLPMVVGDFPGKGALHRVLFMLSQLLTSGGLKKGHPRDNRLQKSPRLWRSGGMAKAFGGRMRDYWESVYVNSKWH